MCVYKSHTVQLNKLGVLFFCVYSFIMFTKRGGGNFFFRWREIRFKRQILALCGVVNCLIFSIFTYVLLFIITACMHAQNITWEDKKEQKKNINGCNNSIESDGNSIYLN